MATRIGIIGAGGMARYHIAEFREAGAEVVAIADVNPDAARAAAATYGVDSSFGDVAEVLSYTAADAVSIIVPNRYHAPLAIQALQAGRHVFCEKPPALNAGEVGQMITATDRSGKRLMFNFNNRARPESYAMRALIADGGVGRINSAQAKWIRRTGIPGFGGWFTTRALSGGGTLIDLLHMVDLALYFMGNPEPAHALGQTFDDFITDPSFNGPWGIPDNKDAKTDVEACEDMGRIRSAQNFVLAIEGEEAPLNTPAQALSLMKIIDALYESASTGKPVAC